MYSYTNRSTNASKDTHTFIHRHTHSQQSSVLCKITRPYWGWPEGWRDGKGKTDEWKSKKVVTLGLLLPCSCPISLPHWPSTRQAPRLISAFLGPLVFLPWRRAGTWCRKNANARYRLSHRAALSASDTDPVSLQSSSSSRCDLKPWTVLSLRRV